MLGTALDRRVRGVLVIVLGAIDLRRFVFCWVFVPGAMIRGTLVRVPVVLL